MAAASVRGFFQRTGTSIKEYFQRMGTDYATVARETATSCKEKPLKAGKRKVNHVSIFRHQSIIGIVFSGLGFLTYAYHTNPTELQMLDYLRERRQQLVLVPNSEHNPTTCKISTNIEKILHLLFSERTNGSQLPYQSEPIALLQSLVFLPVGIWKSQRQASDIFLSRS